MVTALFFAATWAVVFLIRMLFVAPFEISEKSSLKKADLEGKLRRSEVRLSEATADPDLTIISNSAPIVMERTAVPEAGSRALGIFVIYRDVRIINRGHRQISLEISLRLKFGSQVHVKIDQYEVDRWEALSEEDRTGRFGYIFPEVINVPGGSTMSFSQNPNKRAVRAF